MHHVVSIAPEERVAFIADLHLQPIIDDTYRLALQFFEQLHGTDSLFILGDLFEYWIGDDAGLGLYKPAIDALRRLSDSGCRLTVFLGNRDFLLGKEFANAAGATLNTCDESVIDLAGTSVLLMHGDTLCTDDLDYQAFRKQVRQTDWQQGFLKLNIHQRREKAEQLRARSRKAGSGKSQSIMDVNKAEVHRQMTSHRCNTLIHGHTHRPQLHQLKPTGTRRFVVGDWQADHAQYVLFDGEQLSLQNFHG